MAKIVAIVNSLLGMIQFTRGSLFGGFVTYVPWYIQAVRYSLSACVIALAVFGIIHVARGQKKPLPVIGWIKIVK